MAVDAVEGVAEVESHGVRTAERVTSQGWIIGYRHDRKRYMHRVVPGLSQQSEELSAGQVGHLLKGDIEICAE
jgi:hypothetical protein